MRASFGQHLLLLLFAEDRLFRTFREERSIEFDGYAAPALSASSEGLLASADGDVT